MAARAGIPRNAHVGLADLEWHATGPDRARPLQAHAGDACVSRAASRTAGTAQSRAQAAQADRSEACRRAHPAGDLAARDRSAADDQRTGGRTEYELIAARAACTSRTVGKRAAAKYLSRNRARSDRRTEALSGLKDARLQQPSGIVTVWLVLNRSGELVDLGIENSAGSILDRAAKDSVKRASFPPFPASAWPNEQQHRFTAELNFHPQ